MFRLLAFLALAAAAYFAWSHFSEPPAEPDPVTRVSEFVDGHIDEVLGPLPFETKGMLPSPPQNHDLRILRESIRDMERKATVGDQRLYKTAALLCDDLLRAGEERDQHIARINDTRAKSKPSPLAADPEKHRLELLAFFENGIAMSWHQASKKLRTVIDKRYRQLREIERGL